ncbi:RNA polymerase-binding protein RbpA [Clavibacter michiganensis subsp. tessellarius]|uniref:RNA polymerase-binding protein RbpA n=1 Tax=Clavibacter tessellarius TaxID=31965 RepID=UPI00363880F5
MADRSLRGMRLGSTSLQSEEGVSFSPRQKDPIARPTAPRSRSCSRRTPRSPSWSRRRAARRDASSTPRARPSPTTSRGEDPPSHWDMLLERRTRAELEELLEERLAVLRARRGQHRIGA